MAKRTMNGGVDNHAYEATLACIMLDVAVRASDRTQGEMNRNLGYSSRSQLSHYASGLQPIPVTTAERIAREVGLDESAFVLAVLRQRHPKAMREALVDAPWNDAELATMRERLRTRGRAAALELLPVLNRPPERPALRDVMRFDAEA